MNEYMKKKKEPLFTIKDILLILSIYVTGGLFLWFIVPVIVHGITGF